jgi:hypothetical protein
MDRVKIFPRPSAILLGFATLGLLGGCTLIKGALQLPDLAIQALLPFTQRQRPPDPVEVQSKVIRFADHFLEAATRNMRLLQRDGQPLERREITRRRIQYTNDVLAIATGSNAFANLLDMVVMVVLTRMRVESYWAEQSRNVTLEPILKAFREAEGEIWRISSTVLEPGQQAELRAALSGWLQRNPKLRFTPDMADLDFVAEIRQFSRNRSSTASASVFRLLMIDPLSGLDPAAKELAETRLMAERALFLSRHLPALIRWQAEYLTMNTMAVPEIAKLLSDTSKLSESADRFSQVSQKLPELISSEREQLVMTLKSERQGLTALAAESKQALTAGKQMADSANATLKSFQALMAQLAAKPSDPNAEPFRIGDYTAAAAQISQTSERIADLLGLFNQTVGPDNVENLSTRMETVTRRAETSSKEIVDYVYRKILVGSALICAMVLSAALCYQLFSACLREVLRRRRRKSGKAERPVG